MASIHLDLSIRQHPLQKSLHCVRVVHRHILDALQQRGRRGGGRKCLSYNSWDSMTLYAVYFKGRSSGCSLHTSEPTHESGANAQQPDSSLATPSSKQDDMNQSKNCSAYASALCTHLAM